MKTRKELLIEFRNKIAARAIELEANVAYWKVVYTEAKKDTQDRIDSLNNRANQEKSLKKDIKFLEVIDNMIEK